jgi:glycosidase
MGNGKQRTDARFVVCFIHFSFSISDGVGDLRGIIAKLDYLVELGVDIVLIDQQQ